MRKKGYTIPDEALLATDINNASKVLLAFLINKEFNSGPFEIDYTQQELARAFHTSTVTISGCLKSLEKGGYIEKRLIKHPETNRYMNIYRVNWKNIGEKGNEEII